MAVHFPRYPSTPPPQLSALEEPSHIAFYPGSRGNFIKQEDTWEQPSYTGCNACRHFLFRSAEKKSLIKHFYLLGCWDGTIGLAVYFNWEDYPSSFEDSSEGELAKFLKSYGLTLEKEGSRCLARSPEELKALFQIISENNVLAFTHWKNIHDIIQVGKCPEAPGYKPYTTLSDDCPIGPFNC